MLESKFEYGLLCLLFGSKLLAEICEMADIEVHKKYTGRFLPFQWLRISYKIENSDNKNIRKHG